MFRLREGMRSVGRRTSNLVDALQSRSTTGLEGYWGRLRGDEIPACVRCGKLMTFHQETDRFRVYRCCWGERVIPIHEK